MTKRNLVFHVYPFAGNDAWRWNLAQLRQRIDLFDGRRIIAIAYDGDTVHPSAVSWELRGLGCEYIRCHNNPQLGETVTWLPPWEAVEGAPGVTFRAHAKGVSPWDKRQTMRFGREISNIFGKVTETVKPLGLSFDRVPAAPDRMEAMRLWTDILYQANLDHWPAVEALLETHPIVGALKQNYAGPAKADCSPEMLQHFGDFWPPHQFLGSFYWVRNADFFARNWRGIAQSFYGVETWPGFHFSAAEAGCVFYETFGTTPVEKLDFLQGRLLPALEAWKAERQVTA